MHEHQYIDRGSRRALTETLFADRIVSFLYTTAREDASILLRLLTSARLSSLLGYLNFDLPLASWLTGSRRFLQSCGVDLEECLEPPAALDTPRKIFERKIRYWQCRPLPAAASTVVSPADSRTLVGSLDERALLLLKGKFFELEELLAKASWSERFRGGDYAIFRLTPEQYHYNHTPVAGRVVDFYERGGVYHSCNPGAVIEVASLYSKNRRAVTVIDTDVPGGTGVGLVAMVEVVALMIGAVVQCYSEDAYDEPRAVKPGMFLERGRPKSLFRPGSSTDVLIFEPGRVRFSDDLVANQGRDDARSRFTTAFGRPLVETEVRLRSAIASSTETEDDGDRRHGVRRR